MSLNVGLIAAVIPTAVATIGVMDCSFIPKSGKRTAGLDWFYNGRASRREKGLEISVLAVVNVAVLNLIDLQRRKTIFILMPVCWPSI